jgi:small subunit ribosomal protein S19
MARSIKKGPYVEPSLLRKIERMNRAGDRRPIKTWSRRTMKMPDFVGHTMGIHNGKQQNTVIITENMVGHRLGEFAPTRTFRRHGSHTDKTIALK